MAPRGVDQALKVRENRLRRLAERRRLQLRKSAVRDPGAYDFGRWWIYRRSDTCEWRWWKRVSPFDGLSLDQIEVFLTEYRVPEPVEVDATG